MTSESSQKIELRPTDYLKGINFHRSKFSRELIFVILLNSRKLVPAKYSKSENSRKYFQRKFIPAKINAKNLDFLAKFICFFYLKCSQTSPDDWFC